MISGTENKAQGRPRPVSRAASRVTLCLLVLLPLFGLAQHKGGSGGGHPQPARPPAAARPAPPHTGGNALPPEEFRSVRPGEFPSMRPGTTTARPGQEHLPEWLSRHQNLSPAQQENLLRREPGFSRLSPEMQQRYMNRLRSLDASPPAVRQRMLARNEMFQRLSPEGRQNVRAAAQAMGQLNPDRQRLMRRAFNDLRQIPPEQRTEILNSARFSHDFSPHERHVLGSLLSVEPYQPR